jgi:hypothetical protein
MDKMKITVKLIQYSVLVYPFFTPMSSVEKYALIKLTGRNKMVAFAKRIVIRVSFSTACESLSAIKLKF